MIAALVVAPFLYSPSVASAQDNRGQARADEVGAGQHSQANQALPPGIAKKPSDRPLPPGIRRTRGEPVVAEPEPVVPVTEPEPEPDPVPVCLAYQTVWSGFSSTQVCILWGTP
jgi:hypothetical protein